MYPRNAASPPTIDLGQMLQLSDGAIQTTDASVRVKIGTGAWGAGAGTLACDATSGIWTYTPTQAETNDAFFVVGVYKSGCSALSKTVITSASATAGYAGLDWSKITAPTSTVDLSGTTIKNATDSDIKLLDIQSRIPATLDSGNMRSSVQSMAPNTLTASALASDAVTEIQSGLALESTLAVVAGYLDTEIAAIKAKTDNLPSDPASASTLAASFVTVNGKLDAIDDYVDTEVAAIKTVTDRVNTMIVLDGSVYQFTANALELGASSGTVYVLPTKGTQQDRRAVTDEIRIYRTEGYTLVRTVTDDAGANVDLSAKTLEMIIEGENRNDKAVIPDADISVSGTGNATYTIEIPTTVSAKSGKTYSFWLWDKTDADRKVMLDSGKFLIVYAGVSGST